MANVSKDDVVSAWKHYYAIGGPGRKPLKLHFYSLKDAEAEGLLSPSSGADDADAEPVVSDLQGVRDFKSSRPAFPSVATKWWA